MTGTERPEPTTYQLIWENGHVENVTAHQVSYPGNLRPGGRQRIEFHADVEGQWVLQLSALMDDIRTIRNVTADEHITPSA